MYVINEKFGDIAKLVDKYNDLENAKQDIHESVKDLIAMRFAIIQKWRLYLNSEEKGYVLPSFVSPTFVRKDNDTDWWWSNEKAEKINNYVIKSISHEKVTVGYTCIYSTKIPNTFRKFYYPNVIFITVEISTASINKMKFKFKISFDGNPCDDIKELINQYYG